MITLNNIKIDQDTFGDKTLKCKIPDVCFNVGATLRWAYDDDRELFTLQCLVDYIRDMEPGLAIDLELPYIPNARQDRVVSNRLFTLKTFCHIINKMNFRRVFVLDPHSNVSTALLDRVCVHYFNNFQKEVDAIMFPDAGAEKKYTEAQIIEEGKPILIGSKHRNAEGRVTDFEIKNAELIQERQIESVLIKDDLCSFGGTHVAAAKALRKLGVKKVYLEISHCESNIFKGEVFDYIDGVFTTDSIIDPENNDYEGASEEKFNKLHIQYLYRRDFRRA